MKFSVYIICLSVFSLSNLKLHKTLAVENIFIQEKSMLRLTFNPRLASFEQPSPGKKCQSKENAQVASLKKDCALFSRLHIACQYRDGNHDENQPWPPALSQMNQLEGAKKQT